MTDVIKRDLGLYTGLLIFRAVAEPRNSGISAKIPRNQPIVPRILTFSPRKSREIGRFFREFAPENPAKSCFFFREISEALYIA